MHCAHTQASPGLGSRGTGSGRQWRRRHWGRARMYQGLTVDWSGGNGRQGTGTRAEAGTEAGHDNGPGLGHWMAHG